MPADRTPRQPNGFTLLELLVALSVFAIAALALLQMEGASIARTADLDQRLLREIVAQNMAAEILTDPSPPAVGSASGTIENAGRRFQWTRTVANQADYGVLAITVSVRETTPGAQGQAFTLDFTRLPGA
ncbi:MAG: type II secretion system protein GspI [Novosphingobium sp. 28-62-57]|uniref:type II secretion system minor pseudopilin GspI n=1 Tax=unclassified Novosphingobium TaxID=2644732 RepID=UPI000BD9C480|nr:MULTISPECIES: type II secretion system minor pseudopilin GspI [unclassified Novosphingobium]OYW48835.1 MAG: type II secretion system protein GspI [Novosphingobium sp. 12-62-10]OYZ12008.1 MAG: type II secretion system protein GspI [Novosphingobium sp. 28-62-57]OYZ97331.1 MAG: type II secretion system protein GspI [Novosphingobium sp. 17-62-8]HQS71356.1 type II secretion system minor pseudopilin GspI [Novosphingobium sp.]